MKIMMKALFAASVSIAGLSSGSVANAAVTINITQTAGGVVAQSSGSLNTTGFTFVANNTSSPTIRGQAFFFSGPYSTPVRAYSGLTGPSFGDNQSTGATSGTGDAFGFNLNNNRLFLPTNYVSGAGINSTAEWQFLTLSSMGLDVGTYVFSIGTERITMNIGQAAAVPEPATWGLMILGFGMIGAAARSRKVKTTVKFA